MAQNQDITVRLSQNDLGQIREGVEARRDFYRRQHRHYAEGNTPGDDKLYDQAKAKESEQVADHYDRILSQLTARIEEQAKRIYVHGSQGTLTVDGYGYIVGYEPDDEGEYTDIVRCLPPVDALHTGHTDILSCWLETDRGEIIPPEVKHHLMITGKRPDQHKPTKTPREHELEVALRALMEDMDDCTEYNPNEQWQMNADHARAILGD